MTDTERLPQKCETCTRPTIQYDFYVEHRGKDGKRCIKCMREHPSRAARSLPVKVDPSYTREEAHKCRQCGNREEALDNRRCNECRENNRQASLEALKRRMEPRSKHIIYFILAPTVRKVKIGVTVKPPQERMQALQIGSPVRLYLIASIPETILGMSEKALHQQFDDYRSHGEWFHYNGELAEWIEHVKTVCRRVKSNDEPKYISYLSPESAA